MLEQQNIEYKQSWHDDYLKWVCGFANADKKMGNSGFVPPTIPKWFDKKAKFHPEFAELLKIWGVQNSF